MNKTEIKILAFLVTRLNESFSIRFIAQSIKQSYRIVYETVQKLVKKKFLLEKKHGKIKSYQINIYIDPKQLAIVEYYRANEHLQHFKTIRIIINEIRKRIKIPYYTLILFGSYVNKKHVKKSDIDILVILPVRDMIEKVEKIINHYAETYNYPIHCVVISYESFVEMLKNKKQLNVANEVLKKHIIFEGAENYYNLLKEGLG